MYANCIGPKLVVPQLGDVVSLKSPEDDDFKFMLHSCAVVAIGKNNTFVDISNLNACWKTSASIEEVYFVRRFSPVHGEGYYANNNTPPQRGDVVSLNTDVLGCVPKGKLEELVVDDVLEDRAWLITSDDFYNTRLSVTHLYDLIRRK